MADNRNRTPFYGAVPTSKLNANHVFMADGSTLQEQADKKFELIEEITLTENTALIERTTEPDGTPYNFESLFIETTLSNSAALTSRSILKINNILYAAPSTILNTANPTYAALRLFKVYNLHEWTPSIGTTNSTQYLYSSIYGTNRLNFYEPITSLQFYLYNINMEAGSIIKIYAVRA